ncbi:hypothetical protein AbraIFM66951_003739 [Aspergillus brasiliensis]|uniref:Uncharacterized protein n=1 Tax=Aspergillus brasiliensis TaxID=319629 RepID=A0A9W5YMB6_9EURO|nr:hypothetical protein AbraCBS73388_004542 [Aspergillus brasiliensis]GKZ43185.1 hypothetical protein AbraIFM66951_003739 [Aspergillus brasiliensis]
MVTGGGRDIGKAIASAFARSRVKVMIADIDEVIGRQAEKEIVGQGYEARFIRTDVTSSNSIRDAVETSTRIFGNLDIAVNNVGVNGKFMPISELDETEWSKVINTNLSSVAYCLKWELQQMIKQGRGGSIINISSSAALKTKPIMSAYCTSKLGVAALTTTAAKENGCNQIRVNAVAPGMTKTEMLTDALTKIGASEDALAKRISLLGLCAQPEEVADSALWLASESSSYVTGAVIPVDAGYSLL